MFEGKLTSVLNKLLGEYVHGISAKDLSVAVFKGDVVLKNLRLKTEALNALDLPFVVRSGLVGKLSLQIPWRALGKQPVVATIERLYVVAGFADDVEGDDALTVEERTERWEKAKAALRRREIDEGETRWLESAIAAEATPDDATKNEDAKGDGWLAGMLDTVLGNLEVSISKIHVRLEGDLVETGSGKRSAGASCASTPRANESNERFAAGATLESLVINTVDASGAAAFTVGGLAERMRKSAKLTGLAVYFYFRMGNSDICFVHGTGGLFRRRRFVVGARRRRVGNRLAGCVRRGDGTRRRRLERLEVSRRVGSRSSWRTGSRSSRHRAGEWPPVPPRTRERVGVLRAKGKAGAGGFARRGCVRERTGAADPPANRFGRREADVLAPARRVRRRRASRARREARAARAPSPDPRSVVHRLRQPDRGGRERSSVVEVRHRRGDVTDPRGDVTGGGTLQVVVSRRRGRAGDARAARVRGIVRSKRHRAAPEADD